MHGLRYIKKLRLFLIDQPGTESFKTTGSATQLLGAVKSHGGGDRDEEGDATLGDEKRKIYTGPNPLHNR
ncbi:hypothetical protein OIU84_008886 [Salix udensis]|uniref:Uncharacterized protein n=1 Tax=Salix udensis TaxID=889485 RepID=A0AAD6JQC2_9ROSI|nr:hypothetical protein OIU84_008886 [Salix udensis]